MSKKSLKIVVCGPVKGGKTSIANFIAGQSEQLGDPNKILYDATVGARYLIRPAAARTAVVPVYIQYADIALSIYAISSRAAIREMMSLSRRLCEDRARVSL